jgi:hypothetical protein
MLFLKHLELMAQSPHPYIEEIWEKIKLEHKYNKVLFMLLERTLNNDFFKGKIRMNPSKDLSSNDFNEVFEQWTTRFVDKNS